MTDSAPSSVRVALLGLGFGAEFIPIYQAHPQAEVAAICQRDPAVLKRCGDRFGIPERCRFTDYAAMLAAPGIDAVHINTPIPNHAEHSIAALAAGKHVACTVPMATTVEACAAIVRAQRAAVKSYMMMETTCYSREFLYVKSLLDAGELGRIQFLRAAHQQEMAGWPGYWEGLPPMHYATHCVGPMLALANRLAARVSCIGSGRIADALAIKYGSPFAVESAHLQLEDSEVGCEMTRSLFETAREYVESFDVYGSRRSFEWAQLEQGAKPVLFTGEAAEYVDIPNAAERLPAEIRPFTTSSVFDGAESHLSFKQGNGHGGSHPHLAHEFISAIVENRPPAIDVVTAANWTCAGILAHESAMRGGAWIDLPAFTRREVRA
jgi:predicted dehydrogenase